VKVQPVHVNSDLLLSNKHPAFSDAEFSIKSELIIDTIELSYAIIQPPKVEELLLKTDPLSKCKACSIPIEVPWFSMNLQF